MSQFTPVIDGGILAGGLATRMLGRDKGLQIYQDKMMVEWVYQALCPFVRRVIINCNRNAAVYEKVSPFLCKDSSSDFPGPLAGLISLIDYSDADYFLVSPCDTPRLTARYAQTMLAYLHERLLEEPEKPHLFALTSDGKQQPLHVCISRVYQSSLERYLQSGQHKVMQWMSENNAKWLNFSDSNDALRNYNRLDELV
jgi:molybdopterin-guanine dinucleotide biosynthesis protein A